MVIGGEAGLGEAPGLRLGHHAERDAGLHVERAHAAHHGEHAVELLAVLHLAPRRAHAEARRARVPREPRLGEHVVHIEQALARHARRLGVMGRLRAIFAVLRAAAGLDGEEACELHIRLAMVAAMHGAGPVHEVEQGGVEEG